MRINFLHASLLVLFLLVSCGGGDGVGSDDDIPPAAPTPDPPPTDLLHTEEETPAVQGKPVFKRNLALFLVDFPDNRLTTFPSAEDMEKNLEEGVVREYFNDISYGQFTYEIDSYGPFTHQRDFTSLFPDHSMKATSISTIDVSDFAADRYDIFIVVTLSDYEYEAGVTIPPKYSEFRVNGEVVNDDKMVVVNPLFAGCRKRNCGGQSIREDKFTERDRFDVRSPFTGFQRIFIHELIHALGIWAHANSRTNGSKFDYEPEIPNNGWNLAFGYGNEYDIMGRNNYGYNLNVGYRSRLGWLEPPRKTVISDYGCFTATVNPINDVNGPVAVEVIIPKKETRYYLEARDFRDKWDHRDRTPESGKIMADNRRGIMVNKAEGRHELTTYLLDMSPSPNRTDEGYEGIADIRDVVLRPGREYDAPDLRLWDVRAGSGSSFSVRIMVKDPGGEPHESCVGY